MTCSYCLGWTGTKILQNSKKIQALRCLCGKKSNYFSDLHFSRRLGWIHPWGVFRVRQKDDAKVIRLLAAKVFSIRIPDPPLVSTCHMTCWVSQVTSWDFTFWAFLALSASPGNGNKTWILDMPCKTWLHVTAGPGGWKAPHSMSSLSRMGHKRKNGSKGRLLACCNLSTRFSCFLRSGTVLNDNWLNTSICAKGLFFSTFTVTPKYYLTMVFCTLNTFVVWSPLCMNKREESMYAYWLPKFEFQSCWVAIYPRQMSRGKTGAGHLLHLIQVKRSSRTTAVKNQVAP